MNNKGKKKKKKVFCFLSQSHDFQTWLMVFVMLHGDNAKPLLSDC